MHSYQSRIYLCFALAFVFFTPVGILATDFLRWEMRWDLYWLRFLISILSFIVGLRLLYQAVKLSEQADEEK